MAAKRQSPPQGRTTLAEPKYSALHLTRPPARVIALAGNRMAQTPPLRSLGPGQVYNNLSDREPQKERTDNIPFAILRFEKRRGGSATALEKHHERKKETYNSNKDINKDKTELNYHIKKPEKGYYYEIQTRIEAAKCRVRRDSVKMVDTFIGGTNSFICGLPPAEQREYFQRAFDFIAGRVGEKNIFSATVHLDETTPHMHLCFVPLTKDNRLTAKEVLGNRESFKKW